MIKNYNQYIKEHIDIDPYGEEEWVELTPVLHLVKQKNPNKTWDQIPVLDCSDYQLTNLEGIENLTNLKILSCQNNQLINLDGIEKLTNLKKLSCNYNQLTSLEGIENLSNLKYLYCFNNQLTSLEGIENLSNLKMLKCQYNRFSNDYRNYIIEYCKKKKIYLDI